MISTTMKKGGMNKATPEKKDPSKIKKMNNDVKSPEKCSACTCSSPMAKKSESKGGLKKTSVTVKFDCGFPNTLYIRGEGCSSLSWNKGIQMTNISSNEWTWECARPCSHVTFKVLINDEVYESGDNHTIGYGDTMTVYPNFS